MKIAYITDTYLPETNGIVTAIERHSRALAGRGHEFLILCPRYGLQDPPGSPGITVRRYRSTSARSNADTRVTRPALLGIMHELKAFKPDVVHTHTPLPLGVSGVLAATIMHLPRVQTYHSYIPGFMQYLDPRRLLGIDTGPRRCQSGRLSWAVTRLLYGRAELVLTPSRALVAELGQHDVKAPLRCQTNGIIRAEFQPKTDYSPNKRILHAGRLGYEKNVEVVVKAFAVFLGRHPDWTLEIYGEGPAENHLRALVAELGLDGHVQWEGFIDRDRLAEAYRQADIFATASTIETQGIVLLESMASGTPVVGVDALAVPEMVTDGRDGIIVEAYDHIAMAEAFSRLADDDSLRKRMGYSARQNTEAHALERAIDKLERVYHAVAADKVDTLRD